MLQWLDEHEGFCDQSYDYHLKLPAQTVAINYSAKHFTHFTIEHPLWTIFRRMMCYTLYTEERTDSFQNQQKKHLWKYVFVSLAQSDGLTAFYWILKTRKPAHLTPSEDNCVECYLQRLWLVISYSDYTYCQWENVKLTQWYLPVSKWNPLFHWVLTSQVLSN